MGLWRFVGEKQNGNEYVYGTFEREKERHEWMLRWCRKMQTGATLADQFQDQPIVKIQLSILLRFKAIHEERRQRIDFCHSCYTSSQEKKRPDMKPDSFHIDNTENCKCVLFHKTAHDKQVADELGTPYVQILAYFHK